MTTTDPRAVQLAESRYRNGYGATVAWDQLDSSLREFLVSEAANWLGAAIAVGLVDASPTAIADADDPTPLRWGLDDVMWGDDDSVTVLLSGPDREPYWLELDAERAAVLRRNLAGPDGEQPAADVAQLSSTQPCGHDDYHDPHEWADRPGVWCPGHSHDEPAVSSAP